MNTEEKHRVQEHSKIAGYCDGVMEQASKYCAHIFISNMVSGSVLELGPAEGVSTNEIYPAFSDDYTIVDGADFFVDDLKQRFPKMNCICSLFEEFTPGRKFDNILLGHVLEHVEDPVAILKLCSKWLSEKGKILTAVPNSNSIHRQAAVLMGMLDSTDQLNETDKKNGHRRVYDLNMLEADFRSAGLTIIKGGGVLA